MGSQRVRHDWETKQQQIKGIWEGGGIKHKENWFRENILWVSIWLLEIDFKFDSSTKGHMIINENRSCSGERDFFVTETRDSITP